MGISQNQYDYLTNLSQGDDGNAAWAKSQLEGATVDKPTPTPTSGYTTTAPNYTKDTTPSYTVNTPATSYTGSANQIGNVSGSNDLYKSYQDIYNSTRNDTNKNSQLNTWGDSKGNVYDTTSMTAQQIYALSLAKDNNPNASAILKGMGLDMNGNPTSPSGSTWGKADANGNYGGYNGNASSGGESRTDSATYNQPMQQGTMVPLSNNPADYAQGGKYYQAPTANNSTKYNVNDPNFQALPADQRKQILASDPALMQQELDRASKVWFANQGSDGQQTEEQAHNQQLAHSWAEELRAAAANQPQQGGGTPVGVGQDKGQGTGTTGPKTIDWNDPNAVKQFIGGLVGQTMGASNNPNDPYWAQQKANSDLEQQGIFNSKISQYQNLLNSLKTGQGNDLKAITDSIDGATNKIDDKSFQNWLAARQNVASRGLAGSGLASDADTRLLLAKQHDMADMFTGKNAAMNDVNKRYGDQINTAQSGIANTNLNAMQASAFQKLFASGQGNLTDQAKAFATLFGNLSKQGITSEGNHLKYDAEMYKSDMNYKSKIDAATIAANPKLQQLKLDWQKYGLDVTKVMGRDSNGNLTVDATKVLEDMRHNRATENISAAHNQAMDSVASMNASTNQQNAQSRATEVKNLNDSRLASFKLDVDKFKDSHLKGQADTLYQSAQAAQKEMDSVVKQKADYMSSNFGNNLDQNKLTDYDSQIKEASSKIEDSRNAMLRVKDLMDTGSDSAENTNTNPTFQ